MRSPSRVLLVALLVAAAPFAAQPPAPDLILHHGRIITVNATDEVAEAIAIRGDRIVAVGSDAAVLRLAGANTRRIDLGGRAVTPGLLDAHSHFSSGATERYFQLDVSYPAVKGIADIVAAVKQRADSVPAGMWIEGAGWDEGKFVERRMITAADLDAVSPRNPVVLANTTGHYVVVNSVALRLAGITRATRDPDAGTIDRGANGEPTGVLKEAAQGLVFRLVPPLTAAQEREAMRALAREFSAEGMTGFKDPGISSQTFENYKQIAAEGALPQRVFALFSGGRSMQDADRLIAARAAQTRPYESTGDDHVIAGGVKLFADGSGGARTAWMYDDWNKDLTGVDSGNRGYPALDPDTLRAMIRRYHGAGMHISTHSIGDRTIDWVMDSYELALRDKPTRGLRHGIIHANVPTDRALEMMARMEREFDAGYPEPSASFHWWIGDNYAGNFGVARSRRLNPFATYQKKGILWANGSDFSVTPFPARYGIWASVARTTALARYPGDPFGRDEAVDVHTALKAATIWAAHQMFLEKKVGSLEVGKYADLAVWDRDPYTVQTADLKEMKCLLTVFAGKVVFAAPPFAPNSASREELTPIGFHDNDRPAGTLANGELTLALEVRRGLMYSRGPDHPGTPMLAFAEPGQPLRVPGPLIRVRSGTRVRVTITNRSDSTLVLRGLSDSARRDSLVLMPGASGEQRFTTDEPGNRFYYASFAGRPFLQRPVEDGHLAGAIIVDPATPVTGRSMREQILLMTVSYHSVDSLGVLNSDRDLWAVNGRPWPRTQRIAGVVGDSMHFRVINATRDPHPIHLHGVYFRVDARGSALRDTTLSTDQRRVVVTELMPAGSTMSIRWMPERPGTWLLHCHLSFHLRPNIGFAAESLPQSEVDALQVSAHAKEHPDEHVERGMGGLMVAIIVPPPAGWRLPTEPARRVVRLIVPNDSIDGDRVPHFTPSVEADGVRTAPAFGRNGPGATLFLRRGEPTAVRVVNESRDPVAIHWHGMELDSRFDGVVGLGGTPGDRPRAIAPRDSFIARMTPPRAGTFIYHTHLMELRQQQNGFYGAMIVLPPDATFDAAHDHIFITATQVDQIPTLNGAKMLAPIEFEEGSTHTLRLINITTGSPLVRFVLLRADGTVLEWTRLAKDGMDLPPQQRTTMRADQTVSMGETYDMRITAAAPGEYRLELQSAVGLVRATQPIRVVPRRP